MKDKIMAVLEQAVENGDAAGANVLVIHNGKEAVYCGYGMRDMENSLPMERDTIFRLYSQTKPVTAAAAVTLMEQGRLNAGAWLSDYLPEYAEMYVSRDSAHSGEEPHKGIRPAEYDLGNSISCRGQRRRKDQRKGVLGNGAGDAHGFPHNYPGIRAANVRSGALL